MNRQRFLLCCATALVCPAAVSATTDLLPLIAKQMAQYPVVRADFVQTKKMAALKRPLVSRGRMLFSRTEGIFWLIEAPLQVSFWLTEQKIVEFSPDGQRTEKEARSNPALAQISRVMRSLLGAQSEVLRENFEITSDGTPLQWQVELLPRQAQLAQFVRAIKVTGGRFIEGLSLEESSGDLTQTRFIGSEVLPSVPTADRQRFAINP